MAHLTSRQFMAFVAAIALSGGVFGEGAGKEIADELDLDFLGAIGLRSEYQDTSKPTSLLSNDVLNEYRSVSEKALAVLSST